MIEQVREFLWKRVLNAQVQKVRDRLGDHFEHRYTIKREVVVRVLETKTTEAINNWNRANREKQLSFTPAEIKKAAEDAAKTIFTPRLVKAECRKPQFFGSTFDGVKHGGTSIVISMEVGQYSQKRKTIKDKKLVSKEGGGFEETAQPVINGVMNQLYFDAMKLIKTLLSDLRGDNVDYKEPASGILRAHGSTNLKGAKTTVGVLTLADDFDVAVKAWKAEKKQALNDPNSSLYLDRYVEKYTDILQTNFKIKDYQDHNFGGLNRDLVIEVEFGDAPHNKKMEAYDVGKIKDLLKDVERDLKKELKNQLIDKQELLKMKGSDSFLEKAEQLAPALIIKKVTENIRSKNIKKKGNIQENKRKSSKSTDIADKTKKPRSKGRAGKRVGTAKLIAQKNTTQPSPMALANIINQYLPQTLRSMMVAPRLVYRTGRFANSAEVTGVYQGSRGGYSADYTYMKNPYQTFEPGFKMGSTYRDPRSIISGAIREIAIREMGIKFGQVRRM